MRRGMALLVSVARRIEVSGGAGEQHSVDQVEQLARIVRVSLVGHEEHGPAARPLDGLAVVKGHDRRRLHPGP